ncbi:MAG: alpha/beta hydrolase [Acidimicrobiales bacterium]|nr:alpha/beta hydrolase [Acidimicrobiales bacterium]
MRRWSTVVVSVLAGALALSALTACEPEGIYVRAVYDVDRYDDIAYATETDEHGQPEELRFDLYAPRDGERKNRPSVVWAHGGSFTSGDKSSMRWIPEALAARGFVVISINYRLREDLGAVRFPLSTEELITIIEAKSDMQGAVRYLRDLAGFYRLDPDKISVAGYSAGAVMALLVATTPDSPGGSGHLGVSSAVCTAVSVSGAGSELLVDGADAGALLLHGRNDTTVPYAEAVATYDAMVDAGLSAELVTYDGTAHAVPGEHPDDVIARSSAWLKAEMVDREDDCA